ncbi:MAG: hypothetical protein ABF651_04890 [Sporolactobacillus sp.]
MVIRPPDSLTESIVVLVLPVSSLMKHWGERNVLLFSITLSDIRTFAVGLDSHLGIYSY